jgi:hypothetical protein
MTNVGKALQDNLAVLIEIERTQSALLRERIELRVANEEYIAKLNAESEEFRRRTDSNLAEINRKLNELVSRLRPPEAR